MGRGIWIFIMKKHELHGRCADRFFYYTQKDLRTLRSKVRYADEEITSAGINKLTRKELVEKCVIAQLGELAVKRYLHQCKQWEKDHAFVGYLQEAF